MHLLPLFHQDSYFCIPFNDPLNVQFYNLKNKNGKQWRNNPHDFFFFIKKCTCSCHFCTPMIYSVSAVVWLGRGCYRQASSQIRVAVIVPKCWETRSSKSKHTHAHTLTDRQTWWKTLAQPLINTLSLSVVSLGSEDHKDEWQSLLSSSSCLSRLCQEFASKNIFLKKYFSVCFHTAGMDISFPKM